MTAYMLIAPESPRWDRKWFDHGRHHHMRFMDPPDSPADWADAGPIVSSDFYGREHSATLRHVIAPGWKVPLAFWVDDRLGLVPEIPCGYVMPGWLWNVSKESSPLCRVCRRRAAPVPWVADRCREHISQ